MKRGFFISSACVQSARNAFEQFKATDGKLPADDILDTCTERLLEDSGTLDDFYLALYLKNLFNIKVRRPTSEFKSSEYKRAGILSALIDLELPVVNDDSEFEATLLDEFQIANLRRFRFAVEDAIPYNPKLSLIETGCIYMEFNILVTKGTKVPFEKGFIDLPYANRDHFNHSPIWSQIKQNHNVKRLTLHPSR